MNLCFDCPHECGVDKTSLSTGFCASDNKLQISSICVHKGEEPPISGKNGICNIFFNRCNLQCVYCQNFQISRLSGKVIDAGYTLKSAVDSIIEKIHQGVNAIGFVSPSHRIQQVIEMIEQIKIAGNYPTIVYNTNAYDKIESLKKLESHVDVYLPDFKYMDTNLAQEYSGVSNYVKIAQQSIKEMFSQKGSELVLDKNGNAINGLIIRHLILPGQIENSKNVLRFIASELSTDINVSLMSQYFPTPAVMNHPLLSRRVTQDEYDEVIEEMGRLGFENGWVQELGSAEYYLPNFQKENPFES